jgi:hypothetical protein
MFSFSSDATSPLMKAACASAFSAVTAGSTIRRQTDVLERIAGCFARKSTHGVAATQSAMALVLASARAMSALMPPIDFAQLSVSR